ncbi:MAG: phosphonopyruvate decarboxylase [Herbinix sp.]|jgi:phosphonopyruvate decarboxylase|nr:phosphonopyruvate decarboxylase [Herbinix sp.]
MINVEDLYEFLQDKGICYFTGVPDSQLKPFCDFITLKHGTGNRHIIAANEGNAVALAAGYHLATGMVGMVYMQNSGLGNAVNPITSLTDLEVYGIPVIYMIGWRGQPGVKDEPQHIKQGKITLDLLKLLDIEYIILTENTTLEDVKVGYSDIFEKAIKEGRSVAFVVEKDAFENAGKTVNNNTNCMTREEAIQIIVDFQDKDDIIVSTTGKTSRELFEYREAKGEGHEKDFLTVGSMGHASMIATAIAENSARKVWCIDGDGALIMHTGAAALIGCRKPKNLYHILLNNGAHETVGGMPTISYSIDWVTVMNALGYQKSYKASTRKELYDILSVARLSEGPIYIEILLNVSSRENLTRPTIKPIDNKKEFMRFVKNNAVSSK